MGTNIPDFTRYMRKQKGVYWQAAFLPLISLLIAMFGIIATSAGKVVYGEYIWSPLDLVSHWDGPAGRCGAFFVGFAWVIGQIGTNLTANVVSCSNDMTNLFPKYINIRRGVIITTVIGGWIMQVTYHMIVYRDTNNLLQGTLENRLFSFVAIDVHVWTCHLPSTHRCHDGCGLLDRQET
jgi:NCS1 nucleoside transporter family